VWRGSEPHSGVAWADETSYRLAGLPGGDYYWSVAVIRVTGTGTDGAPAWEAVSLESEARSFSYTAPGGTEPTSPPPTKPPEPTPKP
jgi:hypothetical protein